MKLALVLLAIALLLVGGLEIALRLALGFGNPLLYVADDQTGYRLAPNQRVRRFGNWIEINAFSMRGPEIEAQRSASTLRILLLGDSIANGGWWTDQSQTISARVEQALQPALAQTRWASVEVLNASANSWGPRNEWAYVQKFGTFEAQVVVLLINTDDLFAIAPSSVQVGRDRNYPDRKPPLALVEVISRYGLKPVSIPELQALQSEGGDRVGLNLDAIRQIQQHLQQTRGHLLLVMTPLQRELGEPGPRDYELKARQRLAEFTQTQGIPYIDVLPQFNQQPHPASLYRDHIHLSPTGNQRVTEAIAERLRVILAELPND